MALKALLRDKKEFEILPEILRSEYKEQNDGTYVLDLDEKDLGAKVKEFRDSNITLKKERDKLTTEMSRFKDIDPEKYAEAMEARKKLDDLETANLAKAGNIDEVIAKRTETMRKDYEAKIKAIDDSNRKNADSANKYRESLKTLKINGTIRDAITKVGAPKPGAMEDILLRAERTWQLNDQDELHAPDKFDEKGDPITPDAWAKRLMVESPYLFEASQGGGASGGNKGAGRQSQQKTLRNPDATQFGRNLDEIASGKVTVEIGDE